MPTKIELLKIRDFGEIVSDTFLFIKENFKPLIKCFYIFCGFFILANISFTIIEQLKLQSVLNGDLTTVRTSNIFQNSIEKFYALGVLYVLAMIIAVLNVAAIHTTILCFMAVYKEKGNVAPEPSELWGYFKYFFFRILGSGFLLSVMLGLGLVFCLVPGIWLSPILGIIMPIMVFENTSFGYAFNKSFRLIRNNWWLTFGSIIIIFIVLYVISVVLIAPVTLINLSNLVIHRDGFKNMATTNIITAILTGFLQIMYVFPIITASLCYFNMSEQSEGTGLLGRISQLGTSEPSDNLPAEEY
ncbi:MAG TPA: hypothetical protein VGC01_07315 [Mucilaginibacter sp.]